MKNKNIFFILSTVKIFFFNNTYNDYMIKKFLNKIKK